MKKFTVSSLWLVPLFAVLAACGGGGGGDSGGSSTPAVVTLRSIALAAPQSTTMAINTTQTLVPTGTFSDGSTRTLTGLTWTTRSTNNTVLQVTNAGLVTARARGSETVTATSTTAATATTPASSVSATIDLTVITPWTQLAAGGNQTFGVKLDGRLFGWGDNVEGQLGDGTRLDRNVPTVVGINTTWKQISVGDQFTVAIRNDGTLWSWGLNRNGQLGLDDRAPRLTPTQVGTATNWTFVSAGRAHVAALRTTPGTGTGATATPATTSLWVWGNNATNQLGIVVNTPNREGDALAPTIMPGGDSWQSVAAGGGHTLAIKRDQTLWAWGDNSSGQVGNGLSSDPVAAPVQIMQRGTTPGSWSSVSAGANHSMAISNVRGTLYAWGGNSQGQVGNGGTGVQTSPIQIGLMEEWTHVAGGASHTIGRRSDGTLWGWGSGEFSQSGASQLQTLQPTQIGSLRTWTSVAAGANHSAALQVDGNFQSLWTWGRNDKGQLGNGNNTLSPTPVLIAH